MKRGETYSIDSIPKGATYQITQDSSSYIPAYAITNDGSGGNVVSASGDANRNETLSTETETVEKNENIVITFTNNRVMPVASGTAHRNDILLGIMLFLLLCAIAVVRRKLTFSGENEKV